MVGVLAQLVERMVRNHEVRSSILLRSTKGSHNTISKKSELCESSFSIYCPISCPIRVKACNYIKPAVKAAIAFDVFS